MTLTVSANRTTQSAKLKTNKTVSKPTANIGNALNGTNINGIIEHFEQGNAGDCRLLSQLIGLSLNEQGKQAIKNCIKSDGMGGAIVTFKGAKGSQKEFRISVEEFYRHENGKIYSKGDDDVLMIELAAEKYLKSQGVSIPKDGISGHQVAELGENELVTLIMGDNTRRYISIITTTDEKDEETIDVKHFLDEFEKNPQKYTATIAFREKLNSEIFPAHAYALKKVEDKDGKKELTFINPYNSTKELKMDWETFIQLRSCITLFELNSTGENRNLMRTYDRRDELREYEHSEKELEYSMSQVFHFKNYPREDLFTQYIQYMDDSKLGNFINGFNDTQRYIMMKNKADLYINHLDSRASGWGSKKMQQKRNLIDPFISSVEKEAEKFGLSESTIKQFKDICNEELNAKFYTSENKIIEAFQEIIKQIESAKESFYKD